MEDLELLEHIPVDGLFVHGDDVDVEVDLRRLRLGLLQQTGIEGTRQGVLDVERVRGQRLGDLLCIDARVCFLLVHARRANAPPVPSPPPTMMPKIAPATALPVG